MDKRKFVPPGTMIFEQGEISDHAYIIEIGKVDVSIQNQYGDEIFLAQLGPGAIIGEMAAVLGGKRRACVRALDDVVLNAVSGAELRKSMDDCGDMKDYLHALIERRSVELQRALRKQAPERYSGI